MKTIKLLAAFALFTTGAFAQHTVELKTGEKRIGKVQSINNDVLEFSYHGTVEKIKISDIYSINFVEGGEKTSADPAGTVAREVGEKQTMSGDYKIRYKVADRVIKTPPKIDNLTQEKGTVVVEVTVDKYGRVRKAVPGAPGSTTASEYLKTKAMQAAQATIFDNVPTAPLEQTGYIVVVF
jgi:hypothetical protein